MNSNKPYWVEQAGSILDQLLDLTAKLSEIENDQQVDVRVISDECASRLDDLRRLMPQDLKNSHASRSEVLAKMRELYARTQLCLEVLERKNNRVSAEIQTLSRTKQAITAYGARTGLNRQL